VDWWENPAADLVPALKKNRNVTVDIADPLGTLGVIRLNYLYPPFNDVRARRAILMAVNQEDYMRSFLDDDRLWKPLRGVFTPASPLYNEEGGDILNGPRDLEAAKRLLRESGYLGEPVTCLVAQDLAHVKAWGEVMADMLKRLDVNTNLVITDWGTVIARRAQKSPPNQGGWQIFLSGIPGAGYTDPTGNFIRANGDDAFAGWPNIPEVEAEITIWYDAKTVEDEKSATRRLNKAALDHVLEVPLGFFVSHQAWRKNVTGIGQGPLPFFWNVGKTV
jgi:peptide/nickel transport system substrate-binding protein